MRMKYRRSLRAIATQTRSISHLCRLEAIQTWTAGRDSDNGEQSSSVVDYNGLEKGR